MSKYSPHVAWDYKYLRNMETTVLSRNP